MRSGVEHHAAATDGRDRRGQEVHLRGADEARDERDQEILEGDRLRGDYYLNLELIRRATRMGKAVVVYKAGMTPGGAAAAQSHTASIAGDYPVARALLREKFLAAGMGISGANFAVAESGTLGLVTNEGNMRLVTTLPKVHVALVGYDKLVPDLESALRILKVLPRNATGQAITSYVTWIKGANACSAANDGTKELHIIFLDNGRVAQFPYENLFPATIKRTGSHGRCAVEGVFTMELQTAKTGKARVVIDPARIQIAKESEAAHWSSGSPSAPITGKIVQIVSEKKHVRIVVEATVNITVSLPLKTYREKQLLVGESVTLAIPPDAIEVL